MPRPTNIDKQKGFIWLPREAIILNDIEIDGVSVINDVLSADFTKCIFPDAGNFKISLINSDGKYDYTGQEEVKFYADLGVTSKVITIGLGGGQSVTITEGTDVRL